MALYPLGIQTFSKIIDSQSLYIDKTAQLHQLICNGSAYFLSRPRRFGKSLLISTFEALFAGQKKLFKGLYIDNTDYEFTPHPVLKLDFSIVENKNDDDFKQYLFSVTEEYSQLHHIELSNTNVVLRFSELVKKLHEKHQQKVVLLIDEYDKPILSNLTKSTLAAIKETMNWFYSSIKALDPHLRFIFITGVSKFAKVSVFSGMNNLRDISLNKTYGTLCGITELELNQYFGDAIDQLARLHDLEQPQMLAKIKHWYNGYKFHPNATSVYNPFSLLSLFIEQEFSNYWFETATPTFLIDYLKQHQFDLNQLSLSELSKQAFTASEPEKMAILPLLVQTGYLTIKDYNEPFYQLDFPNHEVKASFYESIVTSYSVLDTGLGQTYCYKLIQHINNDDLPAFFTTLRTLFANIPYDLTLDHEKYYQSLFFAIFTLLGCTIEAEVHTNQGRIDCVLHTADKIYIIEFKLNGTKEDALQQILTKQYPQKYQQSGKTLVLLGVEFNRKTRNVGEYLRG